MSRYELLLNSIAATDRFIVQMFLFAVAIIVTGYVIRWNPPVLQRPISYAFYAFLLAAFVFVTVYFRAS